jgi:hypothetical protein
VDTDRALANSGGKRVFADTELNQFLQDLLAVVALPQTGKGPAPAR